MSDMHFHGRQRTAAYRLLTGTPLRYSLGSTADDDGKMLTIPGINAEQWERLSSGERVCLGVLEELADHRATVTFHDIAAKLDDDCKAAVVDALAILCGIGLRAEVRAA